MEKSVVYFENSATNRALVTIAIGDVYLNNWRAKAFNSWCNYATRHNLQIIVITEQLIDKSHKSWKKPQWQKMLIGEYIERFYPEITEICYLDTDIIINEFAPNIFNEISDFKIASVSIRKNLPFHRESVYKKLAVLRRNYLDPDYPLDSALLISLNDLYVYHDLPPQDDEFCSGVLLFKVKQFSKIMKDWFYLYDKEINTITNGGEQTHLNYHVLSGNFFKQLEYRWQAIWSYEVAWKYPFLFKSKMKNLEFIQECAKASLSDNYFLHFASRWTESEIWKLVQLDFDLTEHQTLSDYLAFLNFDHKGAPKGYLEPNKNGHK